MDKLRLCRMCLVQNIPFYEIHSKKLKRVYEHLTNIPFGTRYIRPVRDCYMCCGIISRIFLYRKPCLEGGQARAPIVPPVDGILEINLSSDCYSFGLLPVGVKSVNLIEPPVYSERLHVPFVKQEYPETEQTHYTAGPSSVVQDRPTHYPILEKVPKEEEIELDTDMNQQNILTPNRVPIVKVKRLVIETQPAPEEAPYEAPEEAPEVAPEEVPAAPGSQSENSNDEAPKRELIVRVERLDLQKVLDERRNEIAQAHAESTRNTGNRRSQRLLLKSNGMNAVENDSKRNNQKNPGKSDYHCKICQVHFGRKFTLTRHIRTKHGDMKPYQCEICLNSFARLEYLRRHNRTHAGKK